MFHPDMLLLAERLVIAMEAMSQDVRNMSAYVHDISCSVSSLLNEKRENDCISVPAWDEGDNPPKGRATGREKASAEGEYSGQHKQADASYIADSEHGEISFGNIAPLSFAPHENSGVLSSESNSIFTGGIKIEKLPDVEETDKSSDEDNVYGESISDDRDCSSFVSRLPEGQTSVARTHRMKSAKGTTSVVLPRVDSEERPHKCSVCEKSFKRLSDLQRHRRGHSGERPYKCSMCGKGYSRNSVLTLHIRTHTGQRPFSCDVCGKTFSEKGKLGIHMRSHSGERPYKCNLCGKAFSYDTALRIHMRIHTGEKPYRCNVCGRTFRHSGHLTTHMFTHSGKTS